MISVIKIFHQSLPSDPHIDEAHHKANYHSPLLYKYEYESFNEYSTDLPINPKEGDGEASEHKVDSKEWSQQKLSF